MSLAAFTAAEVRRLARPLALQADIPLDDYLELARLGLRAWRVRRLPLPLWRVGIFRAAPSGDIYRCVFGQGLTVSDAIAAARPWAESSPIIATLPA